MAKRRKQRFASEYCFGCKLLPGGNSAVLIKNALQFVSDIGGITMLNITALHHVDELPFSK